MSKNVLGTSLWTNGNPSIVASLLLLVFECNMKESITQCQKKATTLTDSVCIFMFYFCTFCHVVAWQQLGMYTCKFNVIYLFVLHVSLTTGGDFMLLSCRNSSSVTISLPGEDGRVLLLTPPRCGWALWGIWSYGRVELRDRVGCDWLRPMTSSLERLAERIWRSDVSKTDRNIGFISDWNCVPPDYTRTE